MLPFVDIWGHDAGGLKGVEKKSMAMLLEMASVVLAAKT